MKKIKLVTPMTLFNTDTGNRDQHVREANTIADNVNYDPLMICVEMYNNNNFDIEFHSRIDMLEIPKICKPFDWILLNHQYYIIKNKYGKPMSITKNFGADKFKGKK